MKAHPYVRTHTFTCRVSNSLSPLPWRGHMTVGFICVSADFIFETTRQIYKNCSMGEGVGGLLQFTRLLFLCVQTITRKHILSKAQIEFRLMFQANPIILTNYLQSSWCGNISIKIFNCYLKKNIRDDQINARRSFSLLCLTASAVIGIVCSNKSVSTVVKIEYKEHTYTALLRSWIVSSL